jgi:hypothetical protein
VSGNDRAPLVLFFGSIRAGEHETLAGLGYQVGLLRDSESHYARHIPDDLAVLADVPFSAGVDEICVRIEQIRQTWDVRCLPVVFEGHVELAALAARRLGYPALDERTVLAVRNKTVMRDRLVHALTPDCTGRYAGVSTLTDALMFAGDVGYPVVLKPAQLYNSLHVTPCSDAGALRAAFTDLMAKLPRHKDALQDGRVSLQVEEYLHGSDHSVDVIAQAGTLRPTPVIDVVAGAACGAADFHHFARISPSTLPSDRQEALQELAVRATEALGIRTGAAHVEMIFTAAGPRLVEVAARPGGNRHFLLHRSHGIDLIGGYVAALSGRAPRLAVTRDHPVAVVTPYPVSTGRLRGFRDLDLVRDLPSYERLTTRLRPGDRIGTPLDGAPAPLVVQLSNADAATLRSDIQRLWDLREQIIDVTAGGQ